MASIISSQIVLLAFLVGSLFHLQSTNAAEVLSRRIREQNVNIQVIVGDGNVQGINNNGAGGGSISQSCMNCICHGVTPCFITWPFWADAGRPTLSSDAAFSDSAFSNCRGDDKCAKRAVESYVQKFARDCNGDGKIDCNDYASIYTHGGFGGCVGKSRSC